MARGDDKMIQAEYEGLFDKEEEELFQEIIDAYEDRTLILKVIGGVASFFVFWALVIESVKVFF